MASNPNPYAAPSAQGPHGYGHSGGGGGASLRGDVLVVERNANLASVCMKCGTHDGIIRRQAKFSWSPTWARLSVIFCTIGGAIALAITTKRAQLAVPLCVPCNARWSSAVGALIAGIVLLVLGIFSFRLSSEPAFGGIFFFVALAAFVGLAIGFVKPRMLQVNKIDDAFIELKGVHPSAARELSGG
jgi:hypothetical protein